MNASELLAAYRDTGSEQAFADLIRRYASLVFSVAKRRLGESAPAEDVAQMVFTRLAKSPPRLGTDAEVVAWLHRTTVHAAIDFWRRETRRRSRELQAALMHSTSAEDSKVWEELSPHLDQALDELDDTDRQAVLLRFFEGKAMREIGRTLGVSEDAAKMRVSRAVDRLRAQLSLKGITCAGVTLVALLPQCAAGAAPAQLLVRLGTIQRAVRAAAGTGMVASLLPSFTKAPLFQRAALVAGVGIIAMILFRNFGGTRQEDNAMTVAANPPEPARTQTVGVAPNRLRTRSGDVAQGFAMPKEVKPEAKFTLRVIERGTDTGLAGAQVKAPYFYAGGVGERHEAATDAFGYALIPKQNNPEREAGMNLFVSVEGYVPLAMSFGRNIPDQTYLMELDPAQSVSGTVLDEEGNPVPGVAMEASVQERHTIGAPNVDFQTVKVITDASGQWVYPYVPKSYETVNFTMTCSNYSVTMGSVVIGKPENAVLVIKRGYIVTGRVTDTNGQSVAGATVKELHNFGHRKLTTETDGEGRYVLDGIAGRRVNPLELVVQAKGMAPLAQSVPLLQLTNIAGIMLAPGNVFRGRIVDEARNPLVGAVVRTDYDFERQIHTRFEWLTTTDAQGRFDWDSAPAETICFWFEADGFETIRGRPMQADGADHEIILRRKGNRLGSEPQN